MHKVNKKTILRGHKKRKKIKQLSSLDLNSDLAIMLMLMLTVVGPDLLCTLYTYKHQVFKGMVIKVQRFFLSCHQYLRPGVIFLKTKKLLFFHHCYVKIKKEASIDKN